MIFVKPKTMCKTFHKHLGKKKKKNCKIMNKTNKKQKIKDNYQIVILKKNKYKKKK